MRPFTLLVCVGLVAVSAHAQTSRIVLQGTGGPTVHTEIAAAVAAAQPGDRLYLSGGIFLLTGPMVVDKPLHFIGAGIHPDSSGVTGTTTIGTTGGSSAHFQVTTPASGSTFTGIIFNPTGNVVYGTSEGDDDPTGLVFHRCEFKSNMYLGFAEGATSSSPFDECIILGDLHGRASHEVDNRSILTCGNNNGFSP